MEGENKNIFSVRTLQTRVWLDPVSILKIETLSSEHRLLYNRLLEEVKRTGNADFKSLVNLSRDFRNHLNLTISAKSAQNTARLFVQNIKSFYSLKKKDKTARFPYKFKSHRYFTSFTHDVNGGCFDKFILNENELILKLLGGKTLEICLPDFVKNRVNTSNLRSLTFSRQEDRYFISFSYVVPIETQQDHSMNNFLSIDLGLKSIATCFSNAVNSFSIQNSRFKGLEKSKRKIQSKMDRCKIRSRRHKKLKKSFNRISKKKSDRAKDFQHKVSRKIVQICKENQIGNLIIGDIQVKKLAQIKNKNGYANKGLNLSSQNEGTLSRFKSFLAYKASEIGIDVSLQNEAYTSQENCLTGIRNISSDLDQREVEILPGLRIDRDLNSAINIGKRNRPEWFRQFDASHLSNTVKMYQEMYYNLQTGDLIRK